MKDVCICSVIISAICLSQYLKMRFGRGMQLLGSIQFLVATVRQTSLCSQILLFFFFFLNTNLYSAPLQRMVSLHDFYYADISQVFSLLSQFQASVCLILFCFPQLLYTGIVIYAPALILNQGRRAQMMPMCLYA